MKEIVMMAVKDIHPYANNPRNNKAAVDKVAASLKEFGFRQPIVVDKDMVVIAGHTRLSAAKKLKMKEVPVLVADDLTEEQVKAYRLADNKTAEFAEWDTDLLNLELDGILDIDMEQFGFDLDLGDEDEDSADEVEEDEFTDDVESRCKTGDIWILGDHRLICGDCTDVLAIDKLMNKQKADMVFTDPPYNVAIGSKNKVLNEKNHDKPGNRIETEIENDKGKTDDEVAQDLWLPAFRIMLDNAADHCAIYITMPQGFTHTKMAQMAQMAGWQVKHELIWVKNQPTFSMGRLDYDYKHEPILYGWNKSHIFYGGGNYNKSVWEIDKPRESKLHPTMKPIELIANAILNSTKKSDIVLDLFGGSGSTLIACEQTGRRCFMAELSEHYCDVIINRWEQLTGQEAVLLQTDSEDSEDSADLLPF